VATPDFLALLHSAVGMSRGWSTKAADIERFLDARVSPLGEGVQARYVKDAT
jgi:hypothetical protein